MHIANAYGPFDDCWEWNTALLTWVGTVFLIYWCNYCCCCCCCCWCCWCHCKHCVKKTLRSLTHHLYKCWCCLNRGSLDYSLAGLVGCINQDWYWTFCSAYLLTIQGTLMWLMPFRDILYLFICNWEGELHCIQCIGLWCNFVEIATETAKYFVLVFHGINRWISLFIRMTKLQ